MREVFKSEGLQALQNKLQDCVRDRVPTVAQTTETLKDSEEQVDVLWIFLSSSVLDEFKTRVDAVAHKYLCHNAMATFPNLDTVRFFVDIDVVIIDGFLKLEKRTWRPNAEPAYSQLASAASCCVRRVLFAEGGRQHHPFSCEFNVIYYYDVTSNVRL